MATPEALEGIRVLDFSTVGPAARCARTLADYGAEVVKIGAPPRQSGVQIEPVFHAYAGHRGMKRVRLDLKSADGVEAFLRLAESADVVLESFRPGVVDRLGIGWEALRAVNPRIVYCATSGFDTISNRQAGDIITLTKDGDLFTVQHSITPQLRGLRVFLQNERNSVIQLGNPI